jgi:transposase
LRMGRLPEAWIAPPATRELRELVRHRAKLVALRSSLKCQVHAVLAACGVPVVMSDLFGAGGQQLLERGGVGAGVSGPGQLGPPGDRSPGLRDRVVHQPGGLSAARARWLCCAGTMVIPRSRPFLGWEAILAAVFVAEIGDVHRFGRAAQLASWAGLTPKHHESDTTVHRGRITKQGCRLVRWAAVEAIQRTDKHSRLGRVRDQVAQRRGNNIGKVAAARELVELVFYAPARRAHPLPEPPRRMISPPTAIGRGSCRS